MLIRLFVELSEGVGSNFCTVLICSNTNVLLSLSLWRSPKLSSQTTGIETLLSKGREVPEGSVSVSLSAW